MSTSTEIANVELAKVLNANEDHIIALTKLKATTNLSRQMFQTLIISDSMLDQFLNLDHRRLDPQLQLRYLFRLVAERSNQDKGVWDKLLRLLQSMGEHSLHDFLRKCRKGELQTCEAEKEYCNSLVFSDDISWILEEIVEASPNWEILAVALGLPTNQVKSSKTYDNKKSLCNILDIWLSGGSTKPPTIGTLSLALQSEPVGYRRLAHNLEKKFRTLQSNKREELDETSSLDCTIVHQSSRDVNVDNGMSTLLFVQASQRENMSYQWSKNGQPLHDSYPYHGVQDDLLLIQSTHQGMEGEYSCCVRSEKKEITSNNMTVTVLYPQEKKSLLDLYSRSARVSPDRIWPPVGPKVYITLVLAKCADPGQNEVNVDSDKHLRKRDNNLYKEVLSVYKSAALILVEGCPGSGKTTLVHKLIKDWADGKSLIKAKLVFLISLRMLGSKTSHEVSLSSILQQFYSNDDNLKAVISQIEKKNGEEVCFVFDGLDEYHPHESCKSVVFRLLDKSYLPQAMIIVSSRPGAMARLQLETMTTHHIEVVGFTDDQILEYIDNFPFSVSSNSSHKPGDLKEYLRLHPNIFHLCSLPIHAAIICFVYQIEKGNLPHTQTKIYEEFVRSMVLRHLKRNNTSERLVSLKDLRGCSKDDFSNLCQLAFDMNLNFKQVVDVNELDFHLCEDVSPHGNWSLGLVTCNRTFQLCGISTSYAFLHLTLQEYLAAYFMANVDKERKLQLIKEVISKSYKSSDMFGSFWTFYFGLEDFDTTADLEIYRDILSTSSHGIGCAFESQQSMVCKEIVRACNGSISAFAQYFELPALVYVLCKASELITDLHLTFNTESDIDYIFQHIQHVKLPNLIGFFSPHIIRNNATVQYLSNILESCARLQHITLHLCDLTPEGGRSLADKLRCLTSLEHLKIVFFPPNDDGFSYFTDIGFPPDCTEESTAGFLQIMYRIGDLSQVKDLEFMNVFMDSECCKALAIRSWDLYTIEKLTLVHNNISPDSAKSLSLSHFSVLKALDLRDNKIGSDGAINLASGLCLAKVLKYLTLSGNGIGARGAIAVIAALTHCLTLQHVMLNMKSSQDFVIFRGFQLKGVVKEKDRTIINHLKAEVGRRKQDADLHLGFQKIHVEAVNKCDERPSRLCSCRFLS